jgi:hypothetical protein
MASTYSTSLKLELIGNGDQSGTWGTTTNNNLGTLLEQAITGVETITMFNTDYTLTNYNGASDEARNAVLLVQGTNSAVRNVIAPAVNKVYIVSNQTIGGYAINIKTAASTGIQIPNGATYLIYCDSSEFYAVTKAFATANLPDTLVLRDGSGNFAAGTITATTFSGQLSGTIASATTATTQAPGDNTTKVATTEFVTNVAGSLGTMSTQDANNVNITGGSITGITDLAVADGGTGSSTLTANAVLLGNGTSALQTVAPGTAENVLTSNGTTWTSQALTRITATTGSPPYYGARAWVNFNGTGTVAIRASGNVSSITDFGVGNYQVNFTTAMPDGSYSVSGTAEFIGSGWYDWISPFSFNTTSIRFFVVSPSTLHDSANVSIAIFR